MKNLYLFTFLFVLNLSAQDRTTILSGKITSDSLAVENVHIINKTSQRGTLSNNLGEFKIYVKEKDTLIFSDIQLVFKIITINKGHIKNKKININLIQKNNELPEVVLENMAKSLDLPNAGKKPLNKLERNLNAYSQKSVPMVFLDALLLNPILNRIPFVKQRTGGIDDIYNIISGNRKRDRKLKKLVDADKDHKIKQENIQIIREHFTDDFFIYTIQIEKDHIDKFIDRCIPKGIEELYKKQRYLEVMDIFIQNKENYITSINKAIE